MTPGQRDVPGTDEPGRQDALGTDESRPAGPVGAGDPPPPAVAKASSGKVPPTPPPAGGEQIEHDLDALLADTQRERDEYLDLAKRTKADFENYRKRMSADVQAATSRGKAELVRELIDPLDNLERALHAVGIDPDKADPLIEGGEETGGRTPDGFEHGVLLVFLGLREALLRYGVEPVDPTGEQFDPNLHEALSTLQVNTAGPGTIVETVQKGYRFGEQLIRPARVVVAE
jgi:molecular chaperone GrpE